MHFDRFGERRALPPTDTSGPDDSGCLPADPTLERHRARRFRLGAVIVIGVVVVVGMIAGIPAMTTLGTVAGVVAAAAVVTKFVVKGSAPEQPAQA